MQPTSGSHRWLPRAKWRGGSKRYAIFRFSFAAKQTWKRLLPAIVDGLAELFRKSASWAVVLRDPETDALLLKAHNSSASPA